MVYNLITPLKEEIFVKRIKPNNICYRDLTNCLDKAIVETNLIGKIQWFIHPSILPEILQLKDEYNIPLWTPIQSNLLGFKVIINEYLEKGHVILSTDSYNIILND